MKRENDLNKQLFLLTKRSEMLVAARAKTDRKLPVQIHLARSFRRG